MVAFVIGAEVQRNSSQSIPNSSDTLIQWNNTVRDDASFFSGGANTKLTVQQAGWHVAAVSARFAANTTGGRFVWFKLNGSFTTGPVGASHPTSNDDALAATWVHYFQQGRLYRDRRLPDLRRRAQPQHRDVVACQTARRDGERFLGCWLIELV